MKIGWNIWALLSCIALSAGAANYELRPDDELPVNLSGLEMRYMTWDLFETAAQMDDLSDRQEMLNFAKWMEESQNLLDWIKLTQAEREAWKEGSASA